MNTILIILIAFVTLLIIVNVAAIWLSSKGLTTDENNNMIPDLLEEKMADLKKDFSDRVSRVGEELKDVSKAIKEVGNQIGDIPKAATGKTRTGRKPKKYMEDLKIGLINISALALSISHVNPILQTISLSLAIAFTTISIYKKLK